MQTLTIVLGTLAGLGAASAPATAAEVSYTFVRSGASGTFAGGAFSDAAVSWTLIADTEDVQPGSPRGVNVRPEYGTVLVADGAS
ncbi:MAG: hypothetical protein ACO38P_03680, partial [Phycisphaerales bacterium]